MTEYEEQYAAAMNFMVRGHSDCQADDGFRHRMRDEATRRLAIVLVTLEQDRAVLDYQQPGDALVREKIVERPALVSNR